MYAFPWFLFWGYVNVATRNAAGKVFFFFGPRKKINKKYKRYIENFFCPPLHFLLKGRVEGGVISIVGAFPIKIHHGSPSTPPPHPTPSSQDRVPGELLFRHYCQVPLTPFFLPFYLQQLIRVPLPFSLPDDVSASFVKALSLFSGGISIRAVFLPDPPPPSPGKSRG